MSRRSQSLQSNNDVENIIQRIRLRKLSLVLNMKRRRFGKLDLKIVLFLILFIIVIKNTYATSITNQEPNSDDASKDGYSDQNESINEEVEYDFIEYDDTNIVEYDSYEDEIDYENDDEMYKEKVMYLNYHDGRSNLCFLNGSDQLNIKKEQKWTRGYGEPLHLWLNFIEQLFNEEDDISDKQSSQLFAKFRFFLSGQPTLYEVGHTGVGVLWRQHGREICDGWLYGRWKVTNDVKNQRLLRLPSPEWEFSGGTGYSDPRNVEYVLAYIYQDMKTAIVGEFYEGVLLRGFHRKVVGYRCIDGILVLRFSKLNPDVKLSPTFRFEMPNSSFISSNPKLMDPYEKSNIYVKESTIAGMRYSEGIFAKRHIPSFRLVAVYAGVLLSDSECQDIFENVSIEMHEDLHKNQIELNDDLTIDVPPYYSDIINYRGSLGHKVNNKLDEDEINAEFGNMNHPRFGLIICIRSIRVIEPGEEIFVDYGYGVEEEDWHPNWYKNMLWDRNKDYDY